MIDGEHGVGFASTKRSLQLNDRITAGSVQALCYLRKKAPHSFSDVGALVE
jgi:hypothetical protein